MTSVGVTLRSERENQGRPLSEIAEALCITQRYLRAIESGDLKVLPGVFFYKAFVRQYALFLGLDPRQFQSALSALDALAEQPPVIQPDPETLRPVMDLSCHPAVRTLDPIVAESNRAYFSERKVGVSIGTLAGALLLSTGFYAWWNHPRSVTQAPERPAVIRTVSSVPADAAPQINVTEQSDGIHVALNFSATEKTWLSVTSDGKEVFSGVLEPSQSKLLTGLEAAKIKVGNAGGIQVRWNGKAIGPIGRRGEVRTVMFTPQNFEIIEPPAARKESADPSAL